MGFKIISHISKHAHYLFSVIFYPHLEILLTLFVQFNITIQTKKKTTTTTIILYEREYLYISIETNFLNFSLKPLFARNLIKRCPFAVTCIITRIFTINLYHVVFIILFQKRQIPDFWRSHRFFRVLHQISPTTHLWVATKCY